MRYDGALNRQEASLLSCKTVVRRASCDLQCTAGFRTTDARAPLRWLSLGRWQNTRACRARATCRASCDRIARRRETLRWREASHSRCKAVVRRASCGFQQRTAGFRVTDAQPLLRWLSLGRWRKTHACRVRTPCRASCDRFTRPEMALHWRKASLLRPKTVVRRASCALQCTAGFRVTYAQAPLRWL